MSQGTQDDGDVIVPRNDLQEEEEVNGNNYNFNRQDSYEILNPHPAQHGYLGVWRGLLHHPWTVQRHLSWRRYTNGRPLSQHSFVRQGFN
jgi:hypothetical protein